MKPSDKQARTSGSGTETSEKCAEPSEDGVKTSEKRVRTKSSP
ncbi:hypothetical protein [Lentibacillus persicus]|nr:hypothetical protein [Lentibacillus persicus]